MTLNTPELILGTAMWGWTTSRENAFALLDRFYQRGGRAVDAATNYPINKQPEDFRKAEQILLEWAKAHGVEDLRIMMKVGSLNNMRTPDHNLSMSFLLILFDEYRNAFGDNLHTMMVHWDNRDSRAAIAHTINALKLMNDMGAEVGLSGIQHPDHYAALGEEKGLAFRIQIKHNLLHSDYSRYAPFHGQPRFIAYGVNAGGLKLNVADYGPGSSLTARGGSPKTAEPIVQRLRQAIAEANTVKGRPAVQTMNHCGMAYAWHSPDMGGILIGPSSTGQLDASLDFARALQTHDYSGLYQQLRQIAQSSTP